jgi:hypothetical protein
VFRAHARSHRQAVSVLHATDATTDTGSYSSHVLRRFADRAEQGSSCEPCNHDKGHWTLKEWIRILTRDGDPRAAAVTAFRAARKAAQAETDRRT